MRNFSTLFFGLMLVLAACDSGDADDPQPADPGNANAVSDLLALAERLAPRARRPLLLPPMKRLT